VWGKIEGGFARVPVHLAWTRKPDRFGLWEGRVEADEEIVGLAATLVRGRLLWHKTLKRGAWSDDHPGLYVGFWISADVGSTLSGAHNAQIRLPGVAPAYLVRASHEAPFRIVESWTGETGTLVELVSIGGEEPMSMGALFLARRDTKTARNGFWRLRAPLQTGVPEPFRTILSGPRRGELELGG